MEHNSPAKNEKNIVAINFNGEILDLRKVPF